jgi:AGZA family xanthine/uracil permease-like MFS transporter
MLTQSGGTCVCKNTEDPTCSTDVDYNNCLLGKSSRNRIIQGADHGRHQQRSHNSDCSHCWHWFICIRLPHQSSRCLGVKSPTRCQCPMLTDDSPGMGLNAYFTYQVVGFHGTGPVSYRLALTAVFVEGFVFVFLSLIGMRQWLVKVIPSSDNDWNVCLGYWTYIWFSGYSNGHRRMCATVSGCKWTLQ